jgi:hypothetical protein
MEILREELHNVNTLIMETLIVTPANKIKITVCEPSPLNVNPKLVTVA